MMISASILAVYTKRYGERFSFVFFFLSFLWELDIQIERGEEKATFKGRKRGSFCKNKFLYWLTMLAHLKDFSFFSTLSTEKCHFQFRNRNTASYKFSFVHVAVLQEMQLGQCQNRSASRWIWDVTSSSSNIKMSVLDRLCRGGVMFVQAR